MPSNPRQQPSSAERSTQGDRRQSTRFNSGKHANCRATRGCDSIPVQIKDISRNGLGLLSQRCFELGTVLVLELTEDDGQPAFVLAHVVRLVCQADGQWLVGCTSVGEMSEEEFDILRTNETGIVEQNRRTSVRIPDNQVASCRRDSPGSLRHWIVEVKNRSADGVALLFPSEIEEGARLRITLPSRDGQPATTTVMRVVRRAFQADGRWLLGCENVSPPAKKSAV